MFTGLLCQAPGRASGIIFEFWAMRLSVLAASLLLLAGSGCAMRRNTVTSYTPPGPARGIVFVADGAGGFEETSQVLSEAVAEEGLPLAVEPFVWTHGSGRVLADHVDKEHSVC